MFIPVTLKLVGQELNFTVELTLDLACRFVHKTVSLFPVLFMSCT